MSEKVPELHSFSANDVCLKKDGALCVVYTVKSSEAKQQDHLDMLYELGGAFQKQIHRGINFHFMWLDCSIEANLCEIFNPSKDQSVFVLNPGKRKRYLEHQGDVSSDAISATLEKIIGGDARFQMIKGNKLPEWADRPKPE